MAQPINGEATSISEFSMPGKKKKEVMFNPSGIQPVEYKCLVKPYAIADTDEVMKSAKDAGIVFNEEHEYREQQAQCVALLVAVGGNAFDDWKGEIPREGSRINMAKYAGVEVVGIDGRKYRLISDKDIAGILFVPDGVDPYDSEEETNA